MQSTSQTIGHIPSSNSYSEEVGLSFITVNKTIYLFISEENTSPSTFKTWTLSLEDGIFNGVLPKLSQQLHSNTTKQPFLHDSTLIFDKTSNQVMAFTSSVIHNQTTMDQFLSVFGIDILKGSQWAEIQGGNDNAPLSRQEHSVSYASQQRNVYLFGGTNGTSLQNDFWIYSLQQFSWTQLPSNVTARSGHTSTILSDGKMVLIGGYKSASSEFLNLIQMDTLDVFDTIQSAWIVSPKVKGSIPLPRIYHSAVVLNKNDDVFVCGGQNGKAAPFQSYIGGKNDELEQMSAILDTKYWTWRIPKSSPLFQPLPQSHGLITFVNETKLIYGYGTNYYTTFDKFYVFDIMNEVWEIPPMTSGNEEKYLFDPIFNKNSNSDYHFDISNTTTILSIIIGIFGFAILASYTIGLWVLGPQKLHYKIRKLLKTVKDEIWKPRVGEPSWAEASRLTLKLLFLFIFIYFIFILSNQVIHSPVINQLSYESNSNMTVRAPDIKICFDDWMEPESPVISCTTDFGIQCSQFCQPLEQPDKVCFMFKAPSSFMFGRTSKRLESSGSFLKFDYYYKNATLITFKDSRYYQMQVDLSTTQNDETQQSIFKKLIYNNVNSDKNTNTYQNSYQLTTQVMSTISYELVKRISLNNAIWNYIGIASSVHTNYELETKLASETHMTEYNPLSGSPQPFGSLHVLPFNYETKVLREQKAFAFINAVGVFGGLFGLLYSLQTCLFGYRPRSPWGYMHRWSFGHFRSSLINGLQRSFFPTNIPMTITNNNTPAVPQVNIQEATLPTGPRIKLPPLIIPKQNNTTANYLLSPSPIADYSGASNALRLELIEERVYFLEKLFQAYYIDDEIFRSLNQALELNTTLSHSSSFKSHLSTDSIFSRKKKP